MDFTNIGVGMMSGVAYALLGYGKKQNEAFDGVKFVMTILAGGVAGTLSGLTGQPIDAVWLATNVGITYTIKACWSIIIK